MTELPRTYRQFRERNIAVIQAYEALGEACGRAGPLDAKSRELLKLAMAIGGRMEGAVHAHVRRALEVGVSPAEIRHAVTLAVPTLGFPATAAAFTWVEDILGDGSGT